MLRGKGRDAGEAEFLPRDGDGIADGEDARVEHADDIPSVGLVDDLPLLGHQLLRLRQAHFLAALDMVILPVPLEFAGADAQEGQPVPVGLVHIGLNFKDEGGKLRLEDVDRPAVGGSCQRRGGQAQEFLQKRLDAEIRQRGAEEHGAQAAGPDLFHGKFPARAEELDLLHQLLVPGLADHVTDLRVG